MKPKPLVPRMSVRSLIGVSLVVLLIALSPGAFAIEETVVLSEIRIGAQCAGWVTSMSPNSPGLDGRHLHLKVVDLDPKVPLYKTNFDRPEALEIPIDEEGWFAVDLPDGVYAFHLDWDWGGMIGTLVISPKAPINALLVIRRPLV